ncbi:MAG: hypothetical protein HYZ53_22425 [Planctomycetes bacterium]|nr:hypothetical protein [Planctomycetota bacterium]
MRLKERLTCRICNCERAALGKHVRVHGLTSEEYKRRFQVAHMSSEATRYRLGRNAVRRGWGKIAWTEERILRTIRRLARQGRSLAMLHVAKDFRNLLAVAQERFGSWRAALAAAGVAYVPLRVSKREFHWSREKVLSAIRDRRKRGLGLNCSTVRKENSQLEAAAGCYFGNWGKAIQAAGLDYASIRRKAPEHRWSKKTILAEIKRLAAAGASLQPKDMQKERDTHLLYRAARIYFPDWKRALALAGVDFRAHYARPTPWTRQRILEAIRAEQASGQSLQRKDVRARNPKLDKAVYYLFGAWKNAFRELGLDPQGIRLPHVWPRERVVALLQERARRGRPLASRVTDAEERGLVSAARERFGSYAAALRAAGLDPAVLKRKRYWTRERVIARLQERARQGKQSGHGELAADDRSLLAGVQLCFGSLVVARKAAGVPAPVRKPTPPKIWTRERVLEELRARAKLGKALSTRRLRAENSSLMGGAVGRFGTYRCALEAAGLDPERIRLRPRWTRERVVDALLERARAGKSLRPRHVGLEHMGLLLATRRQFGSFWAALKAAGLAVPAR